MIKNRNFYYWILSVLVIFLHNEGYYNYVQEGTNISQFVITFCDIFGSALTRVAIPSFLFFSGFFYYKNLNSIIDLKNKFLRRIKTVLMPFFVWNLISMIWSYLLSVIPFIRKHIAVRELFSLSIENIINGLIFCKYNTHNWYLAQLAIYVLISPIIYVIFKNKKSATLFLILMYLLYAFRINYCINLKEFCGIYYFTGAYVGKYYYDEFVSFSSNAKRKSIFKVIIYISLTVICQLFVYYYIKDDYYLVGLPWGIASLCFWLLFNCIENGIHAEFYDYYYMNFLAHFIVAPCVDKIIWLFLPHNNLFALFNFIGGSFITIFIIALISHTIKKYMKPLWFLLTGEKLV